MQFVPRVLRRGAVLLLAPLLGVALIACLGGGEDLEPVDLHDEVMEALRTDEVSHLRYTFQEASGQPVEQYELWIDWEHERLRQERKFPERPLIVRVVDGGRVVETDRAPRALEAESFEDAAIAGTHLFRWLRFDESVFREPLSRLESDDDEIERFGWAIEYQDSDSGVCGIITLELEADSSLPRRSFAEACPELGKADGLGYITEYELMEVLPRAGLPPSTFELSSVSPTSPAPVAPPAGPPAGTPTPSPTPSSGVTTRPPFVLPPPEPGPLPRVATWGAWLVDIDGGAATLLSEERAGQLVLETSFDEDGLPVVRFSDRNESWNVRFDLDGNELGVQAPVFGCEQLDEDTVAVEWSAGEFRKFEGVTCGRRSPDGWLMTYRLDAGDVEVEGRFTVPTWDQWLIDLVSGERTLLREGMRHCGGCDTGYGEQWSPSGAYVVLPELLWPGEVYLADVETGEIRLISFVEPATYRRYRPLWAPDGDRLVYPAADGGTVYEDLEAGTRVELDLAWPAAFDPSGRYLYSPAWWLREVAQAAETTVFDTVTGEIAGIRAGDARVDLVLGASNIPVAGLGEGGGAGFAAALEGVEGCAGTTVYAADGTNLLCVPNATSATFSPDGRRVALAVRHATEVPLDASNPWLPGRFAVVVVDVETGAARIVADDLYSSSAPGIVWNEAGTHLLLRWPGVLGV